MADIETVFMPKTEDMSTSLRRRRNATSTTNPVEDSHSNEKIAIHQRLVREINKAGNDEDDEFKRALMLQQMESNKQLAQAQFQLVVFLFVMAAITYIYLSLGEDDTNNKSSLAKALSILLGLSNNGNHVSLPSWAKVFASSSISKTSLLGYSYPSRPWSSPSLNSNFLVPSTDEGRRIQDMLHRTTKLKAERGLNVEIYDSNETITFLEGEHGQQCSAAGGDSIRKQHELFGKLGMSDAQKMLWMWCAFYTGEAYGFVDLDLYEVHLSRRFINDLSEEKIKNTIIDTVSIMTKESLDINTISLASSVLFIPDRQSAVAKSMLHFFMTVDTDNIPHDLMKRSTDHLNEMIQEERDLWTLLHANCLEHKSRWPLATLCQGEICCEVTLPKTQKS